MKTLSIAVVFYASAFRWISGCLPIFIGITSYMASAQCSITASPSATICIGKSATLTASGGTSYVWSTSATTTSIVVSPAISTTYSVDVNAGTCTATITVNVNPAPVINAGGDITICNGSSAILNASGGVSYVWSPGGQTTTSVVVSPTVTSSYAVTGTDTNSCSASDTVWVAMHANPVVNLGPDTVRCGGFVVLNAGNPGLKYFWSSGATSQTDTVSSSGTYWVTVVENSCGNSGGDNIKVTINPIPVVNLGPDAVQCGGSVTLNAGNAGSAYAWSTGASTQMNIVSSSGIYSVVVTDAKGCSSSDTIMVATTGQSPPLIEGFESTAFPPKGWTLNNPDGGITWASTTAASKTGSASIVIDNHNYSTIGQADEIISPGLNLSGGSAPATLTFEVAYQLYTNPNSSPNYSDTLKVQVSTDCGATWTQKYNKSGAALTTTTPVSSTIPFIPTASQWRLETISLPMASQLMVKFINITDYENKLYIDDININNGVNVNEITADNYFSVFPNPSNGHLEIDIKNLNFIPQGGVELKVYDVLGEVVFKSLLLTPKSQINLSSQQGGVYFMEVKSENERVIKKIVVNK